MSKRKKKDEVIERFTPSYDQGLTDEQVEQRLDQNLFNEVKDSNKKESGLL